ncbi:MAG: GTPase [Lachnospiraceae bacterium]
MNGRLDLTEAEAVIDIIEAGTAEAAVNAAGQLGGALSRRAEAVYSDVVDIISHFDAVLDYPDEDIEPFELRAYAERLDAGAAELRRLLASFERGRVLREGLPAAIIGRPNAGKSSLLNALLGYERAIVTAQPGTTRDTIEEKALLGGVLLRLTDTAGLRAASDEAEREGVRRAFAAAEGAELVLAVFDGSGAAFGGRRRDAGSGARREEGRLRLNKADLPQALDAGEFSGFGAVVRLSARTGEALVSLRGHSGAPRPQARLGDTHETRVKPRAVQRAPHSSTPRADRSRLARPTPCDRSRRGSGRACRAHRDRSVCDDVTGAYSPAFRRKIDAATGITGVGPALLRTGGASGAAWPLALFRSARRLRPNAASEAQ